MTLRDAVLARLREAVRAKGLTPKQVAIRSGLHLKTVRRLLDGATFPPETVQAIADALGVDLGATGVPQPPQAAAGHRGDPQDPATRRNDDRDRPVSGWKQAAAVLGLSDDTLLRRRAEYHDATEVPWWRSREAVLEWFEALVRPGRATGGNAAGPGVVASDQEGA